MINKDALVKRRVPLADKVIDVNALADCFSNMHGVVQIHTKKGASNLWVKYDASLLQ
tara:strand:+ start:4620 stop:4790 length:171 start_codon:yes stop_codon:yes gene_type:complete